MNETPNTICAIYYYTRWDKLQLKIRDTVQSVFAGGLGSPLIGRYPFLAPAYLAAGFKIIKEANPDDKPQLKELPYAIHFRYGLKFATVYDMEFAFPVDFNDSEHGFDVFIKAIDIVVNAITDAARPVKYKVTSKFICGCEDISNNSPTPTYLQPPYKVFRQ